MAGATGRGAAAWTDRLSLGFGHDLVLLPGNGMNAADQARSLELAQAIASVVTLVRGHFPAARANLTPWRDDPLTRAFNERESLDLSFHFPGWSPRTQCRSLLLQLRLERAPEAAVARSRPRLLGVLIRGLTYESERWRLATLGEWQPSGSHLPSPEVVQTLQLLCRELFDLFGAGAQSLGSSDSDADGGPPEAGDDRRAA
ncbi:hypothetical protein IFHNHDMJ_00212 [Synechococcus sp. CBW1107]|jgi:hypothetical protein|nr:hypothetical protein IFHNHDMJ_00212 [Synechococcus sp. CBW1107]